MGVGCVPWPWGENPVQLEADVPCVLPLQKQWHPVLHLATPEASQKRFVQANVTLPHQIVFADLVLVPDLIADLTGEL